MFKCLHTLFLNIYLKIYKFYIRYELNTFILRWIVLLWQLTNNSLLSFWSSAALVFWGSWPVACPEFRFISDKTLHLLYINIRNVYFYIIFKRSFTWKFHIICCQSRDIWAEKWRTWFVNTQNWEKQYVNFVDIFYTCISMSLI